MRPSRSRDGNGSDDYKHALVVELAGRALPRGRGAGHERGRAQDGGPHETHSRRRAPRWPWPATSRSCATTIAFIHAHPGAAARGARLLAAPHGRAAGARAWTSSRAGGHGDRVPGHADGCRAGTHGRASSPSTTRSRRCRRRAASCRSTRAATDRSLAASWAPLAALAADIARSSAGRVVVMGCPADEIHAPADRGARQRQGPQCGSGGLGRHRRGALLPTRVHRHGLPGVALDAPCRGARSSGTRSLAEGADAAATRCGARRARWRCGSLPARPGHARAPRARRRRRGGRRAGGRDGVPRLGRRRGRARGARGAPPRGRRRRLGHRDDGPRHRPGRGHDRAVAEAIGASGRRFVADPPALPFATDFGAVSRRVPSALIGVGRPGGWAFHTPQGEQEFASEDGVAAALAMAEVLALAAGRLTAME